MINPEFTISNQSHLIDLLTGKILGDSSLPNQAIIADVSEEREFGSDALKLSAAANASISVQFFNEPTDTDGDGLLGPGDDALIRFRSGMVYVKKSASLSAKADLNFDQSPIKAGAKASAEVKMANYRPYEPGVPALDAVLSDDQKLPIRAITLWDDVAAMEEEELVYLYKGGSANLSMSLAAADLLSGNLSALSKLSPAGKALDVNFGASLNVDFKLSLSNEFRLAIIKLDEEYYRVALIKEKSSQREGSLAFGVEASFADPEQAEALLSGVMESLTARVEGGVEAFIDKVKAQTAGRLNNKDKETLTLIALELGLEGDVDDQLDVIAARYQELKEKAAAVINTVANARVKAGVTYEFSRVKTSEEVFRAVFTKAALQEVHTNLVRFDLTNILLKFREGDDVAGIQLEKYLNQRTYKRVRAIGFTLGIGKWSLSAQSFDQVKRSISTNISGQQQIATQLLYGYTGKLGGESFTWTVDFDASMTGFSKTIEPKLNEFDFGLFLDLDYSDNRLRKSELPVLLDTAQLWGGVDGAQFASLHKEIESELKKAEDIRYSFELKFEPAAFGAAIKKLSSLLEQGRGDAVLASSLAAAMSWRDKTPFRQEVDTRKTAYTQLWQRYIALVREQGHGRNIDMKQLVYQALKPFDENFATMTTRSNVEGMPGFFSTVIDMNRHLVDDWSAFAKGVQEMQAALSTDSSWSALDGIYKQLRHFFGQAYYIRTLGYLLLEAQRAELGSTEGTDMTIRLDYTDRQGQQQSRVIGR